MYTWVICWLTTSAIAQVLTLHIYFYVILFLLVVFTDCFVIFLTVCAIRGWPRFRKRAVKEGE